MRVTTIAAVDTHMCGAKNLGGFEHSKHFCRAHRHVCCRRNQLRVAQTNFGRPIAAVSTHTHVCCRICEVRAAPKGQGLPDQLLLWAYTCVFLKNSNEGHDHCCSEHTHVWCKKKSLGGFEHSKNFCRPIAAVSTHTCVLQKKSIEG